MKKKKEMTLDEFTAACGSMEAAAAEAGVALSTYYRWTKGSKPQGNNARRLRELGVLA